MSTSQPCPCLEPNPSYTRLSLSVLRPSQKSIFGRLKMFKLWQWISKHPQLLFGDLNAWISSMQHLLQLPRLACPILPLQHIYLTSSYALSYVAPLDPIFNFYLLLLDILGFIFTKTRVRMMGTLCTHHLPLGSLFSKLNFPFPYKNPTTLFISFSSFITKTTSSFI
jgi:hypothetical protein